MDIRNVIRLLVVAIICYGAGSSTWFLIGEYRGQRGADRWWQQRQTVQQISVSDGLRKAWCRSNDKPCWAATMPTIVGDAPGVKPYGFFWVDDPGPDGVTMELQCTDEDAFPEPIFWVERGTVCHAIAKERVAP